MNFEILHINTQQMEIDEIVKHAKLNVIRYVFDEKLGENSTLKKKRKNVFYWK
jgi:hypothetical protein